MGPTLPISEEIHATKYRARGESFRDAMGRIANALKDGEAHFREFRDILLDMRFLPAGRIQASAGATRATTAYNCYVSGSIPDSMHGIMQRATEAAETLRMGGGIGYDFSTLRPRGDTITTLQSTSSGPVSFMGVYDALCATICSAGHRRGAQMGVLRVDHPDILEFVTAKNGTGKLTNFNISVGITDEFMQSLEAKAKFDLRFDGKKYAAIDSVNLWESIMRSTWDYADPGVLFLDTINNWNNLHYCEKIAATNPCGEQPLPPYGACLLGSINLTRYIVKNGFAFNFAWEQLDKDIPHIVRAMDNVIDRTLYPLPEQEKEAKTKRRMGIGVTGTANALEAMGLVYGSDEFKLFLDTILGRIAIRCYEASNSLSAEKGCFPLFRHDEYLQSRFIQTLPGWLQRDIGNHGIRNSHLTSIAPTGTISLTADNISSGIEPVFAHANTRKINMPDGMREETFKDYGLKHFHVFGKTSALCSLEDHLGVLLTAQKRVDSAVSKTCNVGSNVTWEEFQALYWRAWRGGAKGCTTFRANGKKQGILTEVKEASDSAACAYDPATGIKSCDA